MKLSPGKIPVNILKEVVFKNLGADRKEVTVGPSAGIDGAVLDLGDKSLVVSMDPITGAVERIGWRDPLCAGTFDRASLSTFRASL